MRTVTVFLSFALGGVAWAQCSMSIDFAAQSNCGGLDWIVHSISNGTPPYDAEVYHGPLLVSSLVDVPASMLGGGAAPGGYAAAYPGTTITVTDAMGCVALGSAMTLAVHAVQPTFIKSLDCTTGLTTLRCTGFSDLYNSGSAYSPCDWPGRTCTVDGVNMGAVSTSWVNEGGGTWRYSQALAAGPHNFIFSGTNLPCNSALECWGNTLVSASTITPGDCGVNFRLRAALDGALPTGTLMTDALRAANLIPTTEPYSALGYTFVGSSANVSIAPALLGVTGSNAIVDWVVVELRSTTTTVVYSKPALLQADGDVIDTDGNAYLNVPIAAGNYYVALRHRNHLGIMTATTRALGLDPSQAASLVDLRVSTTATFGTNGRVQKGSVWCLPAGDATGNGTLQYIGLNNDRDPILTAVGGTTPNNTLGPVYDLRDVNMDGTVKYTGVNNDRDPILLNVGSTTPNNTRILQVP